MWQSKKSEPGPNILYRTGSVKHTRQCHTFATPWSHNPNENILVSELAQIWRSNMKATDTTEITGMLLTIQNHTPHEEVAKRTHQSQVNKQARLI